MWATSALARRLKDRTAITLSKVDIEKHLAALAGRALVAISSRGKKREERLNERQRGNVGYVPATFAATFSYCDMIE
jgi:hypothetical protein